MRIRVSPSSAVMASGALILAACGGGGTPSEGTDRPA